MNSLKTLSGSSSNMPAFHAEELVQFPLRQRRYKYYFLWCLIVICHFYLLLCAI
jgi:hypothetical protein